MSTAEYKRVMANRRAAESRLGGNPTTISSGESDERAAVPADLHEFKVRLSEYGVAMYHGQGEKACVLSEVLESMFEGATLAHQPAESKACASVGVEPAKLSKDIKDAIKELGGGSFPDLMDAVDQLAALASPAPSVGEPAVEAILFALATDDPKSFLTAWVHGDWDVIRKEWPEAPEATIATPAPAVGANDWLLIDGAPKDGRALLLGHYNSAGKWRTLRGKWMSADYIAQNWEEPDEGEPGWYETVVESDDMPNAWRTNPTHYQLLPKEPGASVQPVLASLSDEQIAALGYRYLPTWDQDTIRFARAVLALASSKGGA